ncbi:hypothetical protein MLD38_024390 [Melastoma candidum]|uniref:Uncharacterized protein n=1 Tax=Melastoma candidum TaxID=119954 RepID=A0ACB9NTU6_9MYRT|nr:hypothetical protein MLD38_024390 [Melastoma candidum]
MLSSLSQPPYTSPHQTWVNMGFREDDGNDHGPHQHDEVIKRQSKGMMRKPKGIVHGATSLASIESLSVPLVQEVVLSADMSCAECQKRVADVMSRMNVTEAVEVYVLEKKVILSCKYPIPTPSTRRRQLVPTTKPTVYRSSNISPLNKIAVIKRMFRSINSFG